MERYRETEFNTEQQRNRGQIVEKPRESSDGP
jgi:hypothetical protein